jgi:PAS domain S-box-containing protein
MLNLETEDIPTMKPPPVKLEMPAIKRAELKLTPVFNQAVFDSMLFRASPAGISISRSTTGKYVEVNETLAAMLGYARAELLGRTSLELGIWVERADRVRLVALLEQNGKVRDFKARLRRKSGAIAIMQVAAELIEMEGREHLLAIYTDVTESERQHEELRRAKDAADAANRAKSAFLANMSHEIRTPMNAILGYAQLLHRDPALPPEAKEKLNIISRSGQHLLALIDDVLEMSRLEAGRVTVQPVCFNLPGMLNDLTSMFRLRMEAKGLEFKFMGDRELPTLIVADEGKFRQVLVNLLGNAIKFTPAGSVELAVAVRCLDGPQWWLSAQITDTGIGIAPADLAKLFHQFELATGEHKLNAGTGLGLAISREYARLMGGDITATSQPGRGSCFLFQMPVQEGGPHEAVGAPPARRVIGLQPGQPPVLVLLADDNAPNRNWLKQLLQLIGCQVREAANGVEAIRVWKEWQPHLILMDLQMPVLDGYEATRQIKASPAGDATVIMALTATVLEESQRAILAAGAADLLGKPMAESELFDKMHRHLGVQFLYETTPETGAPAAAAAPEFQPEWVAKLPRALRTAMIHAVANGDLEGFEAQLKQVAVRAPALANYLRPLAEQYDYDQLLRLLN